MKKNFSRLWKATLLSATLIPMGFAYMNSRQGEAWSWGFGRNGQLGLGSQSNFSLPHLIKNIKFVDLSAKKSISAGITIDGKLYTWGKNRNGVLGHHPPNLNVLLPRSVDLDERVVHVSCGYQQLCVITDKGNVYVWGIQQQKSSFRSIGTTQVGKQTAIVKPYKVDIQNITQVSCAGSYISFLNKQGKVYLMGQSKVKGIDNKQAKKSTDIIQLNINQIKRVQSGLNFSIALTENGQIYVWGGNTFGQLGTGSLKNNSIPQLLELRQKIVDISCGDNYAGAVTQNGDVYTWGFGNQGQLGHGDKSDQFLPRKLVNLNQKISKISCGGAHTALITQTGKLLMMGRGRQGQLGRQQKDESNSGYSLQVKQVQQLPKNKKITKVVCGANHTLVLLQELL